jgi:two-component system chemotaxis response regulator CheV
MDSSIESLIAKTSDSFKYNTMQIATFKIQNTDTVFGINVNKVISFVRWSDCQFSFPAGSEFKMGQSVIGLANIRGQTFPLVSFEVWMGMSYDINEYKNVVLCEFNKHQIAFPVKSIQRIYNKASNELERSDMLDGKITYITKVEKENNNNDKLLVTLSRLKKKVKIKELQKKSMTKLMEENRNKDLKYIEEIEKQLSVKEEKREELCLVLDVESLIALLFTFEESTLDKSRKLLNTNFTKKLLIAEDSKAAITIFKKLFEKSNLQYQVFTNGNDLLDYLKSQKTNSDIGFVLSDIEMPGMDGFTLLRKIKEMYPSIPVIMNSSMSNVGVHDKVKSLGADGFIAKTEPETIITTVNKYCS